MQLLLSTIAAFIGASRQRQSRGPGHPGAIRRLQFPRPMYCGRRSRLINASDANGKTSPVTPTAVLPRAFVTPIYAVSFPHVPGLDRPLGNRPAILDMLLSLIIPICVFRRKGWL
jgi:hypothetical protein